VPHGGLALLVPDQVCTRHGVVTRPPVRSRASERSRAVAKERGVFCGRGWCAVRSPSPAYVLVVDEELVEVREATHPSDPEEAWRRPGSDGLDEICEPCLQHCEPSPFGELPQAPGTTSPGAAKKLCSRRPRWGREVASYPRIKERRSLRADLGRLLGGVGLAPSECSDPAERPPTDGVNSQLTRRDFS